MAGLPSLVASFARCPCTSQSLWAELLAPLVFHSALLRVTWCVSALGGSDSLSQRDLVPQDRAPLVVPFCWDLHLPFAQLVGVLEDAKAFRPWLRLRPCGLLAGRGARLRGAPLPHSHRPFFAMRRGACRDGGFGGRGCVGGGVRGVA
jgi:hypothetical protein